jgi:predicted nucleotidyltransferase
MGDYEWACFAAHQAAEKAVKALVQHRGGTITPKVRPGRRSTMPKPFTTFAVTRFVNRDVVLSRLKDCARRLAEEIPGAEVRLFGSYAVGTPTPKSDADIAVVVPDDCLVPPARAKDLAETVFLEAPVPVEIFVLTRTALAAGRKTGVSLAGTVARTGISLR